MNDTLTFKVTKEVTVDMDYLKELIKIWEACFPDDNIENAIYRRLALDFCDLFIEPIYHNKIFRARLGLD